MKPVVKRTYGSKKSLVTSRSAAPPSSSDWSDVVSSTPSSSAAFGRDEATTSPPTSPVSSTSSKPFVDDRTAPSPPGSSSSGRQLRARSSPPPLASTSKVSKSPTKTSRGLLSFFSKVSPPKKRARRDSDSSESSRPPLRPLLQPSTSKAPKKPKLEQLYLDPFEDAGHSTRSCAVCGLSYARTPDDEALHKRHHAKVVGGCDWVPLDKEGSAVTAVEEAIDGGDGNVGGRVVMVNASGLSGVLGNRVTDILGTIDRELCATSLTPTQLANSKLVLFVTAQRKVVACAVAERITGAYQVTPSARALDGQDQLRFGERDGAVFCSPQLHPTRIGIHRIWCSSTHRRAGLASIVLDAVAKRFIYGCPVSRQRRAIDVAFSQPTGAGMSLARAWTGTDAFRVFVD